MDELGQMEILEELDNGFEEQEEISSEVTEEVLIEKYSNGQLRIVRTAMDFPLNNLIQIFSDSTYLNLNPSYQRRNRWDIKKKSLLIESFLMNIPIPPIFLYEKEYNSYEVMDGLQRLQAINQYLDNQFALKSLEFWKELNGIFFKDLPLVLQRGLLRRTITAIVLLAESSKPEESDVDVRMVLFRRLNTGGIQLNPQELRNALYPGKFNDLLLSISREDLFTKVWGIPPKTEDEEANPSEELINNTLYKTMSDCEIVLRFFTIRDIMKKDLKGPLRKLLDNCMVNHAMDDSETIKHSKELYMNSLKKMFEIFKEKTFVLPKLNKVSAPLHDALMVAFSLLEDDSKLLSDDKIKENLYKHLDDPKGYEVLTGKPGTNAAIKERVILARKILTGM